MARKLKIGMIGCGNISALYTDIYAQLTDIALLELIDAHRQRIGLLPRGTGGRPDAQTLAGERLEHLGQQTFLQHFEGIRIAKPQRFVSGHGIHNLLAQTTAWSALHALNQLTERCDAVLGHQFVQPAGHQILLVGTQQNAASLFQKSPELIKIQIT